MWTFCLLSFAALAAATSTPCSPPLEYTVAWTVITESTGRTWNDLGNYDRCQNASLGITEYCLLYTTQHVYGVCIPAACSTQDVLNPSTGIMYWIILLIPNIVLEDPWHATVYCGDHLRRWNIAAYVVAGVLAFFACVALVGTLVDRIDRTFYKLEATQSLQEEADVSVTKAAVRAVIATPPMADVDSSLTPPETPYVVQQQLRRPGVPARGATPQGSRSGGGPAAAALGGGGAQFGGRGETSTPLWQGVAADVSVDSLDRDSSLVLGRGDSFFGRGGGGALVAASSAARISLVGSAVLGGPAKVRGAGFWSGSPLGVELAAHGVDPASPFQTSQQQLRSAHSRPGLGVVADRGRDATAAAASPIEALRQQRAPGEFPGTAGVEDTSSAFVGHAKGRRNSSVSEDEAAGPTVQPYDVQRGPPVRAAVKCFSLIHNWPRLVSIAGERSREFAALNGMRSLSLALFVLGQTVLQMVPVGFSNAAVFAPPVGLLSSAAFQIIPSSALAIDTLFLLSGFLAVVVLLRHGIEDNGGRLAISDAVAFVLHRAMRLLPLYAAVLASYVFLIPLLGSGPFWYLFDGPAISNCVSYWWTNLLFMNNFLPLKNNWEGSCAPWTSIFIAVDMQLCILAPLAVMLYLQYAYVAIASVVVLLALSVAAGAQSLASHDFSPLLSSALKPDPAFMDAFVTKPWARAPAFFMGILLAFAWNHVRVARLKREEIDAVPAMNSIGVETYVSLHPKPSTAVPYSWKPATQFAIILPAVGMMAYCIYGGADAYANIPSRWSAGSLAAFAVVSRLLWSASAALILFISFAHPRNFVNWILSQPIWEPFARLTLGAYFIHPIVMQLCYYSVIQQFRYTGFSTATWFVSNLAITYFVAGVAYLFLEKPFMNLEVLITSRLRRAFKASGRLIRRAAGGGQLAAPMVAVRDAGAESSFNETGELSRSLLIQ